jgi:chromate reductase, NAD(P)H dehydrogenase (quinone)
MPCLATLERRNGTQDTNARVLGRARRRGGLIMEVNIVAISGSLQHRSSNSALLRAMVTDATSVVMNVGHELGELPHFRPDVDGDAHVDSLRRAVARADALLIATPEYAGGMPGTLKNALDWLVGSGELYGKPVVIMSAAPSSERGENARRWVGEVVQMQGGVVRDSFTVAVGPSDDEAELAWKAQVALRRVSGALDGAA